MPLLLRNQRNSVAAMRLLPSLKGMCIFCTHHAFLQLSFFEHIIDVASYYSPVFLKQLCHLGLRQPHCVILQANIYLCLSIFCLVYD